MQSITSFGYVFECVTELSVYEILLKDKQSGIPEMIEAIRAALGSTGDGEINISAYDTAWVALVKSLNGDEGPQFPSCIDWIAQNQLPDGSWGDGIFFLVQDRIISTLACIIALKSWKIHDDACKKGTLSTPIIQGLLLHSYIYNSEHQVDQQCIS